MNDVTERWLEVYRFEPDNPDVLIHLASAAGLSADSAILDTATSG